MKRVYLRHRLVAVMTSVVLGMVLTACQCKHEKWNAATCETPKTCQDCGATDGEALGHRWDPATCEQPQICSVCGKTSGNALGHQWEEATCTHPKTCTSCGKTEGEALGHDWVEATCTHCRHCSKCDAWMGVKLEHQVEEWEEIVSPSCTEKGKKKGICIACEQEIESEIPKNEHEAGEWQITKTATENESGERVKCCKVCGEVLETETYELTADEKKKLFKKNCQAYSYEQLARYPDDYKDKNGRYHGEVVQAVEENGMWNLRVDITQTTYGYTDTIYVVYIPEDSSARILENDIITIYGVNAGLYSYESIFGAPITLPLVAARYIE